nr:Uncharacterised protein [Klebsiella pneumoniae]
MLKPAGINAFTFTNGNGYILRVSLRQWKVLSMKHRIALLLVLTSLSASALAASPCREKSRIFNERSATPKSIIIKVALMG